MDQKKHILSSILQVLEPDWPLAVPLNILVKSEYMDEEAVEGVLIVISDWIQTVKSLHAKEILQQAVEKVRSLKDKEENERKEDMKTVEELLSQVA